MFHEAGFAATGWTLDHDREPFGVGGLIELDLIFLGLIVGFLLDPVLLVVGTHGDSKFIKRQMIFVTFYSKACIRMYNISDG
jgi:hypothetical protein